MKHIRIEAIDEEFRVSVVGANGEVLRKFTYRTHAQACRASAAWAVAHDNCPIEDRSGGSGRSAPRRR
jgi:hypothetical protein